METLRFDCSKRCGRFKMMNATNGGPWHRRGAVTQYRSNLAEYKAARIPYARNHDSAVHTIYGGPYSHDISCIFPNFDADPNDPASYDFACTDESILVCLEAGAKTFFRLGQTIEHQVIKHHIFPPKDFQKWAVICEHIIRHYTEGWANGFRHNMEYWEIWNEPDLDLDTAVNRRTWGGTWAQFYDFYEVAAKHLKACFPHLKFGGPALAHRDEFAEEFLSEMQKRQVPLDFFSWHIYLRDPSAMAVREQKIQNLLAKYGYAGAESICNEWNYMQNWTDQFVYSMEKVHSAKGAALVMGCMSLAQSSTMHMLMYYDTRPSTYNGVFDFVTARPIKGYYAFLWYGMLYDMDAQIKAENELPNIYSLCGVDADGKITAIVTYYNNDDTAEDRQLMLDFGKEGAQYEISLLDDDHDGEQIAVTDQLTFTMKNQSFILIRER